MYRDRFTKIVATLGPASSSRERLSALFEAGADVFRLNFSHGTPDDHRQRVELLRALEKEYKHPIAILMDLQGPKLRLGTFAKGPLELKKGQKLRFDMDEAPGTAKRVPLPHAEIFKAAKPDGILLIDDGKVRLRIVAHDENTIDTEVEVPGTISDRKGVNLPNLVIPLSPMTPKDHRDLTFGLSLGVDWVALSFVQHAMDIAELKKLVAGRAAVMAKLEKPAAIDHLDEIIEQSDGIMVARGDLGVEMPPEAVPPLQKRILAACRVIGRPAIVATQMLESMVHSPTPTRAEASDVATAVYDGTDAVMLSAESASGEYPDRGGHHHGPHPEERRRRSALSPPDGCEPPRARVDHRRCNQRRRPPVRPHAVGRRHRHLHHDRFHHAARGARAAGRAHPLPHARPRHGAAHDADLGRASHPDRGRAQLRRHGGARRARRPPAEDRQAGRAAGDHRRRAVRHARRHQHPAHRLRLEPLALLPLGNTKRTIRKAANVLGIAQL